MDDLLVQMLESMAFFSTVICCFEISFFFTLNQLSLKMQYSKIHYVIVHLKLPEVSGRAENVGEEGVDVEGSRWKSGQGKLLLLLLCC